jgi:hypothetical protein
MAIQEDLTVPYHQQDTSYYCGAACAQMVLASPGVGAGMLDQDDLYTDNHNHSTTDTGVNWATGPDGLEWTMNDRRPAGFTNSFVLFALNNEDAISRKICWTIHHYQVAPISLVYGWAHWIVVRGFDASDAPASSGDTSYSITAFDVNNPWPPVPGAYDATLAPPPPHSATDGCGGGGDRGVANEHITYATWQADYMTGVPGGYWSGKFLSVCDPEPPAEIRGRARIPEKRLEGNKLISIKDAAKRAVAGFEQYGLNKRKGWKRVLKGTSPGKPMLVQRLDRTDSFYYIVPMQSSKKRTPVLASVDARYGNYRQAVALTEGQSALVNAPDQKELLKKLVGSRITLPGLEGRLLVRQEALCVHSTLVWKPCRESLSPYWPFHMISIGSQRIYVRIDGQIFTQLHDDVKGI